MRQRQARGPAVRTALERTALSSTAVRRRLGSLRALEESAFVCGLQPKSQPVDDTLADEERAHEQDHDDCDFHLVFPFVGRRCPTRSCPRNVGIVSGAYRREKA